MLSIISNRLKYILNLLENPNYPSLGPHLNILRFTGLWHPSAEKTSRFKQTFFYIITLFFFSQCIKCIWNFDSKSIKLILQYAPFHIGVIKACFFQKHHRSWEDLISYSSSTEKKQLDTEDRELEKTIKAYISQNRAVTYFYAAMVFFFNFSIFSEPYMKNVIVKNGTSTYLYLFDGYTPFKREPPGYYISMAIQTVFGNVVSAYIVGWDTLVMSLMIFCAGQLKVARVYCRRLIEVSNEEQSHQNIAIFHRHYLNLVRYQRMFNSLISPVMFIYLFVSSVNLGVCIIQLVELKNNPATLFSSLTFIVACLIQLFIFYWHSNEVAEESTSLSYAVYESEWIGADRVLQKEILLLSLTTSKRLLFYAGPYNEMTLSTFLVILKTSYSFFTLMHGRN